LFLFNLSYIKGLNRVGEIIYELKCNKCGILMKKIPIKKLDSTYIIEFYCEKCDESITFYPNLGEIKSEHTKNL
jgi:hypothetical protein